MKWSADGLLRPESLCVDEQATLIEALRVIDEGSQGIAFVVDARRRVVGTLSDGDARRAIIAGAELHSGAVRELMRRDFAFVGPEASRAEVLDMMRARDIGQVPVIDAEGCLVGAHTIGALLAVRVRPNHALILAGGRGTRLGALTTHVPKPMVRVAGRPILERLVLHLMSFGIRSFHLSVSYLAEQIVDHFGDGSRFGCSIEYLREDTPLGTGGPLALLSPVPEHPLVVINGDLVTQCDIGRLIDVHEASGYAATFGVRPYSIQIPYGVAELNGDRLVAVHEKPVQRMVINAGIYVLSQPAIALVPPRTEYPITDLFRTCLERGLTVGAHMVSDDWIDVGHMDELRRARGEA